MATNNGSAALSRPLTQLLRPADDLANAPNEMADHPILQIGVDFTSRAAKAVQDEGGCLRVALIDCYQFSRECLVTALETLHLQLVVIPFASVKDCVDDPSNNFDLVLYYAHGDRAQEAAVICSVEAVRAAIANVPVVVLSDIEEAQQPKTIRDMLSSGAQGFIPTRTTGVAIALAAIRFVKAGGTFAPLEQLLTNASEPIEKPAPATRQSPLTARQTAVLAHVRQGKANKIIAHELSMSESTVKVHVRNIMRKMGATNRTQAAYKAQQMWNRGERGGLSDF